MLIIFTNKRIREPLPTNRVIHPFESLTNLFSMTIEILSQHAYVEFFNHTLLYNYVSSFIAIEYECNLTEVFRLQTLYNAMFNYSGIEAIIDTSVFNPFCNWLEHFRSTFVLITLPLILNTEREKKLKNEHRHKIRIVHNRQKP